MNKFKIIVGAIVIYGVFLIWMLPARFVIGLAPLPAGVKLGAVSGTVWSGKIEQVNMGDIALERLRWQLDLSALLSLNLGADIQLGRTQSEIKGSGYVMTSGSELWVEQLALNTTVDYITQISPLPYGLSAHGSVELSVAQYHYQQRWCESLTAQVKLDTANVASQFGQVPIEHATMSLACQERGLIGTLVPASNSLGIDATVSLSPSQQLTLSGAVIPSNETPQDFINLLNFSSRPDSSGHYPLSFQTILR